MDKPALGSQSRKRVKMTFDNANGDLIQGLNYTVKIIIWDHTVLAVKDRWLLNRDAIGLTGV